MVYLLSDFRINKVWNSTMWEGEGIFWFKKSYWSDKTKLLSFFPYVSGKENYTKNVEQKSP